MNIFKALFLTVILLSTLLPYSNTCGSPLITSGTTNHVNQNSTLLRSREVDLTSEFYVRNLSNDSLEVIQFELLATDGISNFYGEVLEISNGNIDPSIIQELFQIFTSNTKKSRHYRAEPPPTHTIEKFGNSQIAEYLGCASKLPNLPNKLPEKKVWMHRI